MKNDSVIRENRDYKRIYAKGKSEVSPSLVTYAIKSKFRKNRIRIGITTGKKIGNAVHRNRARRVIRAAWRNFEPYSKSGYDMVFVARAKTTFVKMQVVKKEMEKHLEKLGILDEKTCN